MSLTAEEVRKSIRSMVADMIPVQTFLAEVVSVDTNKRTCTVKGLLDELEMDDVLLGVAEGEGNWSKPAVNSQVLVGIIQNLNGSGFVVMFSKVDEVYMKCDGGANMSLKTDGKVRVNGDIWESVKAAQLKTAMDANKQILDVIKQVCSVPVNEPGNGAASVFQAALNAALSSLQTGDHSQINNPKVLHGNG